MGRALNLITFVILIVIVLIFVSQWALNNPQQAKDTVDAVCGINNHLLEIQDAIKSISPENTDTRSAQIMWDLLGGKEVSDCDLWYFYQQLDEENQKKFRIYEFVCNLNDCLKK